MSRFVITGATGGAPNRLEINDFVKQEKYFSLFIQALQAMQRDNQGNDPSYFLIGKIHGLPYGPWNGSVGTQAWDPNTTWGGYCTHGSVLFPTWHRPYMMVYEQIIQSYAVQIAATYTVDQDAWKKAAQELRHPFWDWAVKSVPPDEIIALQQVTITGPNGNKIMVDNPWLHYTFHPIDPSFPAPYDSWPTTIRQPTVRGPGATDNVARMKSILQAAQLDITSSTYNMLTRVHAWPAFSNHTVGDGGSTSNSLEAIHDGIHGNIGGGGNMSDPGVAAFDPIFYLHHCSVDRMLQLWSALNPGVWVTPNDADTGTFTIPAETPVDQTTALTPFWNGPNSFWTSDGLKDTKPLGYNYPDFNGLDMGNPLAVQVAIANRVNQLYGSSIFNGLRPIQLPSGPVVPTGPIIPIVPVQPPIPGPIFGGGNPFPAGPVFGGPPFRGPVFGMPRIPLPGPPAGFPGLPQMHWGGPFMHAFATEGAAQVPVTNTRAITSAKPEAKHSSTVAASSAPHGAAASTPSSHDTAHGQAVPDMGLFDWTARIECKKYELGGSFCVLLFLGQVPDDPQEWHVSPNFVGSHQAFVNTSASQCANCRSQADLVIEGFVHLNQAILNHSGLNSLEESVIKPYLKENLHWRVQTVYGEPANLSSLEVCVYVTPLSYPPGAVFPVPGERTRCSEITLGREGGCRQAV